MLSKHKQVRRHQLTENTNTHCPMGPWTMTAFNPSRHMPISWITATITEKRLQEQGVLVLKTCTRQVNDADSNLVLQLS